MRFMSVLDLSLSPEGTEHHHTQWGYFRSRIFLLLGYNLKVLSRSSNQGPKTRGANRVQYELTELAYDKRLILGVGDI